MKSTKKVNLMIQNEIFPLQKITPKNPPLIYQLLIHRGFTIFNILHEGHLGYLTLLEL